MSCSTFRKEIREKCSVLLSVENAITLMLSINNLKHGENASMKNRRAIKNKYRAREREEYRCYVCGRDFRLHVHHIHPIRTGGNDSMDNLVTLCSGCHCSIESGDVSKAVFSCVKRALRQRVWKFD